MTQDERVYLPVDCRFFIDGRPPEPRVVWLPDGRGCTVIEILDRQIFNLYTHGHLGMRYTCRLLTGIVDVWYTVNEQRWYMQKPAESEA